MLHFCCRLIRIHRPDGTETRIYAMTSQEASMLWEVETEAAGRRKRCILFSETPLAGTAQGLEFFSCGAHEFSFCEYRHEEDRPEHWRADTEGCLVSAAQEGWFENYHIQIPEKQIKMEVKRIHDHKMLVSLEQGILEDVEDILLQVDYTGNVGYAFSEGRLFHDHFYNGAPWEIGLSRFKEAIPSGEIVLETTPLRKGIMNVAADASMAVEQRFEGEQTAVFHQVSAKPVYRIALTSRLKEL